MPIDMFKKKLPIYVFELQMKQLSYYKSVST